MVCWIWLKATSSAPQEARPGLAAGYGYVPPLRIQPPPLNATEHVLDQLCLKRKRKKREWRNWDNTPRCGQPGRNGPRLVLVRGRSIPG